MYDCAIPQANVSWYHYRIHMVSLKCTCKQKSVSFPYQYRHPCDICALKYRHRHSFFSHRVVNSGFCTELHYIQVFLLFCPSYVRKYVGPKVRNTSQYAVHVHLLSSACSGSGHGGSRLNTVFQRCLAPQHRFPVPPSCTQAKWQRVLGLPRDLLPVGSSWETSTGRYPGATLIRCPNQRGSYTRCQLSVWMSELLTLSLRPATLQRKPASANCVLDVICLVNTKLHMYSLDDNVVECQLINLWNVIKTL